MDKGEQNPEITILRPVKDVGEMLVTSVRTEGRDILGCDKDRKK